MERVTSLLQDGVSPNDTFMGWMPITLAAEKDRVEILRMILDSGAGRDATNAKGRAALSFAAAPSTKRPTALATFQRLLEFDADLSQQGDAGLTAKDRAAKEGSSVPLTTTSGEQHYGMPFQ